MTADHHGIDGAELGLHPLKRFRHAAFVFGRVEVGEGLVTKGWKVSGVECGHRRPRSGAWATAGYWVICSVAFDI